MKRWTCLVLAATLVGCAFPVEWRLSGSWSGYVSSNGETAPIYFDFHADTSFVATDAFLPIGVGVWWLQDNDETLALSWDGFGVVYFNTEWMSRKTLRLTRADNPGVVMVLYRD